ncbi:phage antirepressor N-terminal domain-containing protein [Aliarcobacter butzleri]|uniref:phage antirepressor N-terminal domain-containing protein n=1 Tax=Aliarcobacter butzleri TaxID=28197 RepID=UPI0021B3A530|nr:phage antirepressor N-terminal domain-containing protein [Aliarcobacter butzleri]MCT7596398.1 phage antirepressor N-terminal domain-containing protein [Aliarcobacter butzleri]
MDLIQFNFNGDIIDIVERNDIKYVSVGAICRNIGLVNLNRQYKKIQEDDSFESKFIDIEINNVIQNAFFIPLSKLNGWLFFLNPNKVKPEVKQKLIEYKKECFNVLNNYFNNGIAINHRVTETDLQKILDTLEKQNQEIKDLKKQLVLKEEDKNPFKGFYGANWAFRKRENEYAYSRKDWMLLLNECERTLVAERQNRKYKQLLISGASK